MKSGAIKSFIVCAVGAVALAGCASSPSSKSAAASVPQNVHVGKVSAVETVAVVDQTTVGTSSGGSAVVTKASGGPSAITVSFNDGSEGKYIIDRPVAQHSIGQQVYVITDGDHITIVPQ